MSKYARIPGLSARIVELRDGGLPWDAEGGVVEIIRSEFSGYTTQSAIPARKLYNAAKAEQGEGKIGPNAKKAIVKARDGGMGWDALSARTGRSISELKKLYTDGGGTLPLNGRLYVNAEGTVNHRAESTRVAATDAETTE